MTAAEFKEKFLSQGEAVYRVARYILESEEDAADAVQDLFAGLWISKDSLDTVHNPRAYCLTLIRNRCIDRLRRRTRIGEKEVPEAIDGGERPDTGLEMKERLKATMRRISKLPPKERLVLEMRVFDELSYDEMAERTGMSKLTLRVMLSNARRKLSKAR